MKWKTIENYPRYEVSESGTIRNSKTLKIKKPYNHNGYAKIQLLNDEGRKSFRVHRLVVNAFIKKIEKDMHVDHINRVRSDNRVENLRIVSPRENLFNRKFGLDLVDDIIDWYESGATRESIKERLKS